MRRKFAWAAALVLLLGLTACGGAEPEPPEESGSVLVYGSHDYTRINPLLDEHGEINLLLFNGLTAHDGENGILPGLAREWTFDEAACAYTFYLEEDVRWHDGEPFTSGDVRFTIEAIRDPANDSENAPNYEDVLEILTPDPCTVTFRLAAPNAAFLDYMTIPILPRHLLEGEDLQTSAFFRSPVGTGPYRLSRWDAGQAITMTKNEDYFREPAKIDTVVFKIVEDDNARALQLSAGELDLALLPPRYAAALEGREGFTVRRMQTSDYRGILFNFHNPYWQENRDLIPALCCALDRQAILDAVLLGHGTTAYGPLQRNPYNYSDVEHYDYDPVRAEDLLRQAGCVKGADGFYTRNGQPVGFVLSVGAGDQVRLEMAQAAAQQLRDVGVQCTVEIPAVVDWSGQMAYLIGWGSPFDADDHTYKVFGTGKGANYSGYSNPEVDRWLTEARSTADPELRREAYARFQTALAQDPAFAFLCYVDADYAAVSSLRGITEDTVLGHHGVGIFWNITQWTLEEP